MAKLESCLLLTPLVILEKEHIYPPAPRNFEKIQMFMMLCTLARLTA